MAGETVGARRRPREPALWDGHRAGIREGGNRACLAAARRRGGLAGYPLVLALIYWVPCPSARRPLEAPCQGAILQRLRGGMIESEGSSSLSPRRTDRLQRPRHGSKPIRKTEKYVPKVLQADPYDKDPPSGKRRRHHMAGGAADMPPGGREPKKRVGSVPEELTKKFLARLPDGNDAPAPDAELKGGLLPVDENLPLTKEQAEALDYVRAGKNIFLTGSAGTGKSFVLKHVIAELRKRHGGAGVHVTASTGSAAVLIGGTTVHSFAGVGLGHGDAAMLANRVHANKPCVNRWRRAKALVIDEVSMIDAELFQKISYVAQRVRDNTRPFGGLQLVLSGDFFQLPPVSDGLRKFAFESDAWGASVERIVELKRVMRQEDGEFVRILNEVRWGNLTGKSYHELIKCQNKNTTQWSDGVAETKLHPYNVNVRAENERKLTSLPGETRTYSSVDKIQSYMGKNSELKVVKGHGHQYAARLDQMNVERVVTLKVGAQVMLLKNLDVSSGLCNGARGVVVSFEQNVTAVEVMEMPRVKFACGVERIMQPEAWSLYEGEKVVAERRQIPLSLAWAVSVHKCQGMTLDRVEASLSRAFDHGMVYVALSRVKSLAGLKLSGFVPSKVTAHPAVVAFYRKLGCVPPGEAPPAWAQDAARRDDDHEMRETTLEQLMEGEMGGGLVGEGMREVEYWGGGPEAEAQQQQQEAGDGEGRAQPRRVPLSKQKEIAEFDEFLEQVDRADDDMGDSKDDLPSGGITVAEIERIEAEVTANGTKGAEGGGGVVSSENIIPKIPFAMPAGRGVTILGPVHRRVNNWRNEFVKSDGMRRVFPNGAKTSEGAKAAIGRHAVASDLRDKALEKAEEREEVVRESASLPASSLPSGMRSEFLPASLLSNRDNESASGRARNGAVKKGAHSPGATTKTRVRDLEQQVGRLCADPAVCGYVWTADAERDA